ncbi:Sensory/regulatory protein RpfC [Gimesia alba]|uniref:Sensory/regulatory protein RpfC n=1 Tax=Gimesia alba TaxID=2527973 RepID=A0A517RMQ7_9PLAN|nr:response regulator [Gimesia alba]QDT45165.1 Sensory/regulatory protein RpfC [Gimesia alba]
MKVLVVDDIGYSCHYYARLVEKIGFTPMRASSGFEALEVLKTEKDIHVVLTDLMMSGMDGVDLFQQAQLVERYSDQGILPSPHFILMTDLRLEEDSQDRNQQRIKLARKLGFSKIMLKPVDYKELKQELNDLALNVIQSSTSEPALDLYSLVQKLRMSVKEIVTAGNKEAGAEFLKILQEEIDNLKKHLKIN